MLSGHGEGGALLGKLLSGAGAAFLVTVGGYACGYLMHIVLARSVGESQYGTFVYATTWTQVLAVLASLGVPNAVLYFVPKYAVNGDLALLRGLIRRGGQVVVVAGLAVGGAAAVGYRLSGGEDAALTVAFALVPVLAANQFQGAVLRARGRIVEALAPVQIGRPLLVVAGLAVVVLSGWGRVLAVELVLLYGAALLVAAVVQAVMVRRTWDGTFWSTRPAYQSRTWSDVALYLLLVTGFHLLLTQTDLLMLGVLGDPATVGLYNAAAKTAMLGGFVLGAVGAIGAPLFAEAFAKGRQQDMARIARWTTNLSFWPSVGVALLVVLLGRHILGLFGSEFVGVYAELCVLVFAQLVSAACGLVGTMLNVTGLQRKSAMVYATTWVVNVALNLVLIPAFGVTGAAAASAVSVVLWNVWLVFLVRWHLGVHAAVLPISARGGVGTQ